MIFSVVVTVFVMVASVELSDKTMFATLVLASRLRPLPVLAGVATAFAVQVAIAVAAGLLALPVAARMGGTHRRGAVRLGSDPVVALG